MNEQATPIPPRALEYMHPARWQDHVHMDGDAVSLPRDDATKWEALVLRSHFRWHAARRAAGMALTQFRSGSVFDATKLNRDSYFNIDVETVQAFEDFAWEPDDFENVSPFEARPLYFGDLGEHYYFGKVEQRIADQPFVRYSHIASFAYQRRYHLVGSLIRHVGRNDAGRDAYIKGARTFPLQIEVGQTHHTFDTTRRIETLERIHRIDVLSAGSPDRSRSRLWAPGFLIPRQREA